MSQLRSFIEKLDPILRLMPTVPRPKTPQPLTARLMWTFVAITIYLLLMVVPLYGVYKAATPTAGLLRLMSLIFATSRGTLAHLGIGPIVIAGILLEILVFSGLLDIDLEDPVDRARFNALMKLLSLVIAFFESLVAVTVGMLSVPSIPLKIAVIIQLMIATLIIILLDDLVTNGWGLGSGISLFILVSIAKTVLWYTFSPVIGPDTLPVGIIPALIAAAARGIFPPDLVYSFFRGGTIVGLISTILLGFFILYLEMLSVPIPLSIPQYRGIRYSLPLRVMYVSVLPIIFTAFTLILVSHMLQYVAFAAVHNPALRWLACIQPLPHGGYEPCVNSVLYFLWSPPPPNITPQYVVAHIIIYVVLCTIYAYIWVNIAGMSAEDQAKYIVDAKLSIPGFRPNLKIIARYLEKYIFALTITSGILSGLIAALGDLLQVFSGGIGLMLLIEIALQYYGIAVQEHVFELFPGLKRLAGIERL